MDARKQPNLAASSNVFSLAIRFNTPPANISPAPLVSMALAGKPSIFFAKFLVITKAPFEPSVIKIFLATFNKESLILSISSDSQNDFASSKLQNKKKGAIASKLSAKIYGLNILILLLKSFPP